MDRDPIAFAWRAAPLPHLGASVCAVSGVLVVNGLLLAALGGLADALPALAPDALPRPFLRIAVSLPEPFASEPTVLFRGWDLGPVAFVEAGILTLAVSALVTGLAAYGCARLRGRAGSLASERLRNAATEAAAGATSAGRDDVRSLAGLTGAALRTSRPILRDGIAIPAFAVAAALVAVAIPAWEAPLAGLAVAVGLLAAFAGRTVALARKARVGTLHGQEDASAERAVSELTGRLPALRAHGTAALERARVDAGVLSMRRLARVPEAAAAVAQSLAVAALLAPMLGVAAGTLVPVVRGAAPSMSPGWLLASMAAAGIATVAVAAFADLRHATRLSRPAFEEIARVVAALRARRQADGSSAPLPSSGLLTLEGVSAYDPASGERVSGVDLAVPMPAHIALTGDPGGGARVLAQVIAGQIDPTAGRASFAGIDLGTLDPVQRARRIAYAGGEPILIPGTLQQNLLYGTVPDDEADAKTRLVEALTITGLDRLVYARGLTGPVGSAGASVFSGNLVEARASVQQRLAAEGASGLVDPFDPARYNRHATVGENVLFGVPVGDTFGAEQLARHPFLRAVLEAEGLSAAFSDMGLSIARATIEIFADLPDDHPLFDRFSLFPASERGYFEEIVARRSDGRRERRGAAGSREKERLVGLALRYSENRHRFGLVDPEFEDRVVSTRRTFAALLPPSLKPAIEFYHPARIITAASLQDNLLFGRIADDEAGAEARVRGIVRAVLQERGLDEAVYRVGLAGTVTARSGDGGLHEGELAAIDLARCLVRRPDILVVENALDEMSAGEAAAVIERLRSAYEGRSLVLRIPGAVARVAGRPFDLTLHVERGLVVDKAEPRAATPVP